MFDLKQALNENKKTLDIGSLDNGCFSALTVIVEPKTATELEEKQFHDWVRVQFPTLFYGLELWLRKHAIASKSNPASSEQPNKVNKLIERILLDSNSSI